MIAGVVPASNDVEFFPGMPTSWAHTFMIDDDGVPTGRPAGSLAWAGLVNLCYRIDRENRIGGFWGTQTSPFAGAVSVGGSLDLETAVHDARRG